MISVIISSTDAGSDYQQTDVDQHITVTELRCHKPDSMADQGNHILVSGQVEFTSMFIIKNIFLKQVRSMERIEIDRRVGAIRLGNINFSTYQNAKPMYG